MIMMMKQMPLLLLAMLVVAVGCGSANAIAPPPAQPPAVGTFEDLPGNEICVRCNVTLAFLVLAIELAILWPLTVALAKKQAVPKPSRANSHADGDLTASSTAPNTARRNVLLHLPPTLAAMAVAGFGWAYWFATFALYWNFISYALLIGPIVTLPPILYAYLKSPATSSTRSWLLTRRVELSGWLIAALMLALFSNLTVFPGQLQRHLSKSESLITPNDELVQQFKADFLAANPSYHTKDFVTRMQLVDNWVKDKVTWKSDMSQYGVVGLLTTPHEVLERHAGDCQGQSAVTASLLFALGGVQAWCTETPFHWWTHARDDVTRETYNLNAHGHAGLLGSVLPQPVDMQFTWYPAHCDVGVDNCTSVTAHNQHVITYVAPPWRALAVAFTGTHEFRRDILPKFGGKNLWQLPAIGVAIALVLSLYASYFQADLTASFKSLAGLGRLWKRFCIVLIPSVFAFVFFFVWGFIFYPIILIHLVGLVTFCMCFVCSDSYNHAIGTPTPTPPAPMGCSCGSRASSAGPRADSYDASYHYEVVAMPAGGAPSSNAVAYV